MMDADSHHQGYSGNTDEWRAGDDDDETGEARHYTGSIMLCPFGAQK
ncbi:hypothetical protein [Escherichia coli]